MPAPATTHDVADLLKKTRLFTDDQVGDYLAAHAHLDSPARVLAQMQTDNMLTPFQAEQILKGRHKGFVLGKYRLLDRIGMGGMGQVYLAEHAAMRKRVAVKVLPPNRSDNPFAKERFLREARAAALLEHPNLVRCHDLETDGDVTYLVMDYIEGSTLHDLVMRRGPQSVTRTAHFLRMIALGLSAVHERLLVHRDIKPANLLMDRSGVVRLLDLGLVRSELDDDALTRGEGAKIVGTADYLAPEQAVASSKVDGRADLYSLGCTAYFLLTGEPPFTVEKLSQKLIAHQVAEVKPPHLLRPSISVEFSNLVLKLLAKKPADRHQSAVEVIAALEPFTREAAPEPVAADFPSRNEAVYGPSTMGLSLSSRINIGLQPSGRHALPGLSGANSDIRTAPEMPSGSQVNQNTAAAGVAETLRDTPRPSLPAPRRLPVEVIPPAPRREVSQSRVAALFGTPRPPSAVSGHASGLWFALAATVLLAAGGVALLAWRL